MRRSQLLELLRALGPRVGGRELVMIGSQCVHAATDRPPGEVVMSVECDLLVDDDELAAEITTELGKQSAYMAEHGIYVDVVSPSFPYLPPGWEQRLRELDIEGVAVRCLEVHDMVLSKLVAGRLKDHELIAALIQHGLVDVDKARERISAVADLHTRALLLARLQFVFENMGR